jgi:hypothetical protein
MGAMAHACNPSYPGAEIRRITVQSQPQQMVHETLSQKYPSQKRAGGVTQVVEHLPSKHEPWVQMPPKQCNFWQPYQDVSSTNDSVQMAQTALPSPASLLSCHPPLPLPATHSPSLPKSDTPCHIGGRWQGPCLTGSRAESLSKLTQMLGVWVLMSFDDKWSSPAIWLCC